MSRRAAPPRLAFARQFLAACLLVGCTSTATPSFTVAKQSASAALLAAWGDSASDVWIVGGGSSATTGPLVYHLADGAWSQLDSGQVGIDLWWAFGFDGGDVFFSGSSGTILRYHDGTFEAMQTPSATAVVFGMWGPTADDIWAVGRASADGPGSVIWHFDGTSWTAVPPPSALPAGDFAFKVHGQRTDDVWIALSGGDTLHWTGSAFDYVQTGDPASLFSIVTTPTEVVTAGDVTQIGDGALYENTGSGWQLASLAEPIAWHGVTAGTDDVFVVGDSGAIARRDGDGAWSLIEQTKIQATFHAAWEDPDGGLWGVGGDFDQTPTHNGFLLYYGTADVPAITE